ncbi:MAG: tetratricopeptide repeat protein [Bacteroidota bacterium]|nr:tetratricopeptide repeat protein [Bacteroidota bacterium]
MKTIQNLVVFFLTAFVLVSCGPSKSDMQQEITQNEEALFAGEAKGIDKGKAALLINSYVQYADAFPEDSMSPDYLFRAADISMNIFESGQAIDLYNRIINNYPEYEKVPQCVFLKAFVYENNLNDLNSAKKYYKEFLAKYPDDEFADDAEMSLQNLGKSPEELIKEFEAKMKEQEEKGS